MTTKELAEQLVALGLSTDIDFVHRFLLSLRPDEPKQETKPALIEVMTLKDFLRVFQYEAAGQRVCEQINHEFK